RFVLIFSLAIVAALASLNPLAAQSAGGSALIRGEIRDARNGQPLVGATVIIRGTTQGATTNIDGKFSIEGNLVNGQTYPLVISYIGYNTLNVNGLAGGKALVIKLEESALDLQGVEIVDSRISEKQKESALTVEAMDILAVKETPSPSFYQGLGTMKGVDLTTASLGFVIINTRGFNSTSPVRSLQLIDGVDNQAPGLNFSLGNFLGVSELDIQKVDLVVGASSAFFGPNAFNGVINMSTRSPFQRQGINASIKVGERALTETAIRYAWANKDRNGNDKMGWKFNMFYLKANDWRAENYGPSTASQNPKGTPGGYDAVNVYGDEDEGRFNDARGEALQLPGLGIFYPSGYREADLVDYDINNLKLNTAFHYMLKPKVEFIASSNFGTGTTVYQGENRFRLKNILFFQNRLELRKEDDWFIRAYATNEDAGDSYDAVATAKRMKETYHTLDIWNKSYASVWQTSILDSIYGIAGKPGLLPDHWRPYRGSFSGIPTALSDSLNFFLNAPGAAEALARWHEEVRFKVNNGYQTGNLRDPNPMPFALPGSPAFDSLFNIITTTLPNKGRGGTLFYDKSALYHLQGEKRFKPIENMEVVVGGSFRQYRPDSRGTIFSDTVKLNYLVRDTSYLDTLIIVGPGGDSTIFTRPVTDTLSIDTTQEKTKIVNSEYGLYGGIEYKINKLMLGNRLLGDLKINATFRTDKNINFKRVYSPAVSMVLTPNQKHVWRLSLSSAVRNPTLADQYLYYNVGPAILVGNVSGFDSLITLNSFLDYLAVTPTTDKLKYFDVKPIQPEQVRTVEFGYRGMFKKLYVDAGYYHSWYTNFIGFNIGVQSKFTNPSGGGYPIRETLRIYRVAANATGIITTQGFSLGGNYYLNRELAFNFNYSWNKLVNAGKDTVIIPAFNTPEHKYNVGLSGRDMITEIPLPGGGSYTLANWGFNINYKWIQGFEFQGSPQFTGPINSYGMVDAQINKTFLNLNTTLKLGASNLLNNKVFQVYGGPLVGRLAYVSLNFELK
ncbi:MAG: TonB-dependent receptor, partial [Sphingomonadales bacterium]|nr:TonB-dependent receptor [Sphingomonadales bacterium]